MVESVVPPNTLPSTIPERCTGATITESKKPSLRSSITDIMVKIEVNSTIMINAPAKKYCRKFPVPGAEDCKELPKPAPIATQKTRGDNTTPTTLADGL